MFKIARSTVQLVVATLFFAVAPTSAQTQVVQAKRPEINVGDSWTYSYRDTRYAKPASSYTMTIESVTADRIKASWKNLDEGTSGTLHYDKDFNLFSQGKVYPAFDFPLEVGKTWSREYDSSAGDKSWHNNVTTKVVAFEKVTVPAGTFEAFRIVLVRNYVGSSFGRTWSGTVTDTWWYAPQVRNFIKRTFVDSGTGLSPLIRELLKFSVH